MEQIRCVVTGLPVHGNRGGVVFRQAGSLAEVGEALRRWEADVVAVDAGVVELGELSGLVTDYPHVPVVAVASYHRMPDAARCGVAGLVPVPAEPDRLAQEVRAALCAHRKRWEAVHRQVLRPLLRLRELVPADGNPETVLRRLAEFARSALAADRAAAVVLHPGAPDLAVALTEQRGGQAEEHFWTVVPEALASAQATGGAEDARVATVPLAAEARTLGALTVARRSHRPPFGPTERELLDVLGVVGALPLVQVDLLRQLQQGNQRLIDALAYACELHEASLRGHGERLSSYALAVGRRLGFREEELEDLRVAGMLHDVGKIGISDSILLKPGPLTPEEYETVKRHTVMGAEILSAAGFGDNVVRWVLHHHERWDGTGYPMGLAGQDIPAGARVLAVADAYEVMTTGRVYRGALLPGQALEELHRQRGRQFCPEAVDAFTDALKSGEVRTGCQTQSGRR